MSIHTRTLVGLSEDYYTALEECRAFHAMSSTLFPGTLLWAHMKPIRKMRHRTGAVTLLDYGCGKGNQWQQRPPRSLIKFNKRLGFSMKDITLYDPAWPPYASLPPSIYDMVIVTHTLGAIPMNDIPIIAKHIFSLAEKGVYIGEKLTATTKKKVFSDYSKFALGWSAQQWLDVLGEAASGFLLDIVFGALDSEGKNLKVYPI